MGDNSEFPGIVLAITLITYWIGLTAGLILSKNIGSTGFTIAGILGLVISGIPAHYSDRYLNDQK